MPRNSPFKSTSPAGILSSCNGLLCLATRRTNQLAGHMKLLKLALWNPSTGNYKKSPSAEPTADYDQTIGFGYDSSLDNYKIVRIIMSDMYSLKVILGELLKICQIIRFFGMIPKVGCI